MEALYSWVTNISFYLIFITVLGNMLPSKKYEKYIRFFAGMVLILLVIKPFTSGLRIDDRLSHAFESISFQTETQDLKAQLTGMEQQRLSGMVKQYEEAVSVDLERMAQAEGFYKKSITVTIGADQSEDSFGAVTKIVMILTRQEEEGEETLGPANADPIEKVVPVAPVTIETDNHKRQEREEKNRENSAVNTLRTRISEYYGLEAQEIEIRLEDE